MRGGLPPAPRWAWLVMALAVTAIVALSYLTLHRPPPPRFAAPAAAETTGARTTESARPLPQAQPAPTTGAAPSEPARILVVGEGFSTPVAGGSWPDLVRGDLEAAGRPVAVTVAAADLAGYAEPDPGGLTFPQLARQAGGEFDVVVFFGSRHDIAAAGDVRAAAEAAFAAAREASPEADLVAIGPAWEGAAPGYIVTNRDAVAAASGPFGAVFVDPLAAGWFSDPGLVAADGVHPTAQGHRYLADLIRPVLERELSDPE